MRLTATLKRKLGQLLVVGFPGTTLTPRMRHWINQHHVSGYILFRHNIAADLSAAALNAELQQLRPNDVPLAFVDQEGGRVRRFRELVTAIPAMATIGDTGIRAVSLARQIGAIVGTELAALGIHVNCAPVLDVHTNPANVVIGDRAFSDDPARVGALGVAYASGLESGNVIPCGKHFPGHGDTLLDSHTDLPVAAHAVERLRRVEWAPFRHAILSGMPMLMTAHVVVPALTGTLPATLSPAAINGALRGELGFGGVVITDDLDMGAIRDHFDIREVARSALDAGVDLLLVCHDETRQHLALETLYKLARDGELTEQRLQLSTDRIATLRNRYRPVCYKFDPQAVAAVIGCDAHRQVLATLTASE